MQDDQLLTQYARTGSDAAFSHIIARHLPLVYRTCRRELGSNTLAEDAAQVVFLLLARKAKTLRAGPSLAGWLFQTARFVAKDVRKQEARRLRREEAVMQEAIHQQTTPTPEWDTVEPLLNNALASLKPADREAVLLRFFEGHTLAETGALLGLSEDAARMRCARALDKLRRYLESHGAAVTSVVLTGFLTTEAAHPVPAHAAATITQGTLQAISTGPTANVLLLSKGVSQTMKVITLKYATLAAAALIVGASVPPLAHAFIPHRIEVKTLAVPVMRAETSAQAAGTPPVSRTPAAETQSVETQSLLLQHVVPADVIKFMHWEQAAELPAGVTKVESGPAQNALTVTATPAGQTQVQAIVKILDIEPRQVLIQTAYAHVTGGDLRASGIRLDFVPPGQSQAGVVLAYYQFASGSPAARLLQALTKRGAVDQQPELTTTNNVSAKISMSTTFSATKTQSTELDVVPRINSDVSVTLALHAITLNGTVKREISTLRTIKNGDTIVLVVPPAASSASGNNLLLFVTPTVK